MGTFAEGLAGAFAAGSGCAGAVRNPFASKVKVFTSSSSPCRGSAFPLNSKSTPPTFPAFTTSSCSAVNDLLVPAMSTTSLIRSFPSAVIVTQQSSRKLIVTVNCPAAFASLLAVASGKDDFPDGIIAVLDNPCDVDVSRNECVLEVPCGCWDKNLHPETPSAITSRTAANIPHGNSREDPSL